MDKPARKLTISAEGKTLDEVLAVLSSKRKEIGESIVSVARDVSAQAVPLASSHWVCIKVLDIEICVDIKDLPI